MTRPKLGFADLSKIQPDKSNEPSVSNDIIDRVAEKAGFTSREPTVPLTKRSAVREPSTNLNIRPPVGVYNRFVAFSIDHRMSYPEALAYLMDLAGLDETGSVKK
ncbi:hypothetical protein [Castellaniella sp.]|uniref:hypothetical protein n=1 Tax=Castellaniella sp. TaxID=1955812 RepID=UPI002AFFFDCA|nr:hypothetical protein [Castellaniella sp.]